MKTALKILSASAILATVAPLSSCTGNAADEDLILRSDITLASDTLTPEALWAMGRIGSYAASPDGTKICYQVSYYSVEQNRSNTLLYIQALPSPSASAPGAAHVGAESPRLLGLGSSPVWLSDDCIAFESKGEVWTINTQGKARKQITRTEGSVEGFLFSFGYA